MSVDASAVARVVGISTSFKDTRGGKVSILPQRIAVFAQGQSGVSYSTAKWTATGAGAAGAKYGYKSPIYLALLALFGLSGDGVGSIPVDVFPLAEAGGSTAAAGDITPSGNPTVASEYKVRIGGVLSGGFSIPAGNLATAANLTAANKKIGDAIAAVQHMPALMTYTYGTVTAAALVGTGNGTIGTFTTSGNPKPGVWRLQVVTAVANGGVWSLTDPDGVIVSSSLTQTVGAGAATPLSAGGLGFTITDGATDFGLGAYFDITVPATKVNVTSPWKGTSANKLKIEIVSEATDVSFALTQPTGGTVNPTLDAALALMGNVWNTLALNCLNLEDTAALDALKAFGDGRWGELTHKPFAAFTGCTDSTVGAATVISAARASDKVNGQISAPGSTSLPFIVAARALARIAKVANDNPACDYGSQQLSGSLVQPVPGADSAQWDYAVRDQAVKAGASTSEVRDGVIVLGDTVMFYHPTGESPPAYRYLCDVVKLQNILYNLQLRFATTEWDGAPLVSDDATPTNPKAKQPKMAKAVVAAMLENLEDEAIITDAAAAKETIVCAIDSGNPKRLNISFTVQLSGNANIISIDLSWGFYFGSAAAA